MSANPALEIGTRFVQLAADGKDDQILEQLYSPDIVSIEGSGSDAMPARLEGMDAIRGKHQWWYDNHEIHSTSATGPFVGHRTDQFAVRFDMDITPKSTGERSQMSEVGLFTIKDGKVVQEEFLYQMG